MPPDFLNSREDAILIWLVLGLFYVMHKDASGIGRSFVAVVRAAVQPKLLLLFGSVFVYSSVLVATAARLSLWHVESLKITLYWFFGTAVVLAGEAVSDGGRSRNESVRRVATRVLAASVVIEFALDAYPFPLAVELVGVFIIMLFAGAEVVARHDPATPHSTVAVIRAVLAVVVAAYVVGFLVHLAVAPETFFTRANAEQFLLPPAMTLLLLPFLYLAFWWSRREQESIRRRLINEW